MGFNPSNIRIIWIAPRSPLGAPDGARHATCTLIRHLTQLNLGIDLVCIVPATESVNSAAVKNQLDVLSCFVIPRSRSLLLRLPSLTTPLTFRAFAASGVRKAIKEHLAFLLKSASPTQEIFIVFDGLHPFAALSEADLQELSSKCRGVVYRAHNVETTFWEQCEERARTPWFRWFFRHQAALVRSFERRIAQSVNLIAPVSEEDAAKFRSLAPGAVISVTPIGMDFPDEGTILPVRDSAKFELLFIGRLDWIPNRAGLQWFLEKIWPRLIDKRKDMTLKIAGVGDGRWLEKFRGLAGVEFLGRVDDVKPLYESSTLSIAPLFQGSGTRVKILEAARYGRAVLTTTLGAEGSGLVPGISYFRAESQEEWLNLLGTMTKDDCRKTGLLAMQSIRRRFNAETIAKQFIREVAAI